MKGNKFRIKGSNAVMHPDLDMLLFRPSVRPLACALAKAELVVSSKSEFGICVYNDFDGLFYIHRIKQLSMMTIEHLDNPVFKS